MNLFYTKCRDINTKLPEREISNLRIREIIDSTFKPIITQMDEQLLPEDTTEREEAALIDYLPYRNLRIDLPKDSEEDEAGEVTPVASATEEKGGGASKAVFEDDDDELIDTSFFSRDDIKKQGNALTKAHVATTGKKKH